MKKLNLFRYAADSGDNGSFNETFDENGITVEHEDGTTSQVTGADIDIDNSSPRDYGLDYDTWDDVKNEQDDSFYGGDNSGYEYEIDGFEPGDAVTTDSDGNIIVTHPDETSEIIGKYENGTPYYNDEFRDRYILSSTDRNGNKHIEKILIDNTNIPRNSITDRKNLEEVNNQIRSLYNKGDTQGIKDTLKAYGLDPEKVDAWDGRNSKALAELQTEAVNRLTAIKEDLDYFSKNGSFPKNSVLTDDQKLQAVQSYNFNSEKSYGMNKAENFEEAGYKNTPVNSKNAQVNPLNFYDDFLNRIGIPGHSPKASTASIVSSGMSGMFNALTGGKPGYTPPKGSNSKLGYPSIDKNYSNEHYHATTPTATKTSNTTPTATKTSNTTPTSTKTETKDEVFGKGFSSTNQEDYTPDFGLSEQFSTYYNTKTPEETNSSIKNPEAVNKPNDETENNNDSGSDTMETTVQDAPTGGIGQDTFKNPNNDNKSFGLGEEDPNRANYDIDDWNRGMETISTDVVSDERLKNFIKKSYSKDPVLIRVTKIMKTYK